MKRNTIEHPKMRMLIGLLDVPTYAAVGILESLWHMTARSAPAGDIGKWANPVISTCIGWDRPPDELVGALIDAGWLDPDPEHRLLVHDWPDHCDDATHMAMARKGRRFANGATPKLSRFSKEAQQKLRAHYARGVRTAEAEAEPSPGHSQAEPSSEELPRRPGLPRGTPRESPGSNSAGLHPPPDHSGGPLALGALVNGFIARVRYGDAATEAAAYADELHRFSRDGPEWRTWYAWAAEHVLAADGASALDQWLDKLREAADPVARATKDIGAFHVPGRWLVRQITAWCRDHGIRRWPDFPS